MPLVVHSGSITPVAPPQGRRRNRLALAMALLATVLVLVPTPELVSAAEMRVTTHRVEFQPRTTSLATEPLAPAAATSTEGPALRAALDARVGRNHLRRHDGPFQAVGITAAAIPDQPVLVRGQVAGLWTPWVEVHFVDGEAPDRGTEGTPTGAHSDLVWLGGADAYELDAPESLTSADVHLVGDNPRRRSLTVTSTLAGAATAPSVAPRSAWGARAPRVQPSLTTDLKVAIVHHSVNTNTYSAAEVPALLRAIQAYHQDVQGWDDIAYNFAVDRFGKIWEARAGGISEVVRGGHAQGFNTGSVGVVVLGDFRSTSVPSATVESVAQVIAWKFALHRVNPSTSVPYTSAGSSKYAAGRTVTLSRVVAHRDVQNTDCPGAQLYARLGTIRTRVAQLVPIYQTGIPPTLLAPDLTGDGLTDPLSYRPGSSPDAQWRSNGAGSLVKTPLNVLGTYRPTSGDFDGNGRSDILWHGRGSAPDYLWWSESTGAITSQSLTISGSYLTYVGDYDKDGTDDIFFYGTGLASDYVWYFQRNRSHVSTAVRQDSGTAVPLIGDYDGDGDADIFHYGPGPDEADTLWRSTGQGWAVANRPVYGWYKPVATDATGNGRADIIWYAPGSNVTSRWEFDTAAVATSRSITTSPLSGTPIAGDFDADGRGDVAIVAAGAAADQVWYSTPTGIDARAVSVLGTYVIAAGPMDTTNRGSADLFFLSTTASSYLWPGRTNRTFGSIAVG